jgi:hypothetical protein
MIPKMATTQQAITTSENRVTFPDEYVCWSRMQAEAGQPLELILARKELERQVGDGVFLWGVGNAPATIASKLARTNIPVRAVFSVMKSKPKVVDTSPQRVVAWRRFIDADGVERPLAGHVLVTSRGDSAGGPKRTHFALMCRSDEPLTLRRGESFDPTAFRNAGGTGAPVGASQVTALLRRVKSSDQSTAYEANITAWLTLSYWVRLVDPVEIDGSRRELLARLSNIRRSEWRETVATILSGQAASSVSEPAGRLF